MSMSDTNKTLTHLITLNYVILSKLYPVSVFVFHIVEVFIINEHNKHPPSLGK
jgi:hypothetical protein